MKKNKGLKCSIVVFLCSIIILGVVCYKNIYAGFIPPEYEVNMKRGTPVCKDGTLADFMPKENYHFVLNARPRFYNNQLNICFGVSHDCEYVMRFEVYEGDRLLGKSGVLKAGEYLENIDVDKPTQDKIRIKVISYVPQKWFSGGNVQLDLQLSS